MTIKRTTIKRQPSQPDAWVSGAYGNVAISSTTATLSFKGQALDDLIVALVEHRGALNMPHPERPLAVGDRLEDIAASESGVVVAIVDSWPVVLWPSSVRPNVASQRWVKEWRTAADERGLNT